MPPHAHPHVASPPQAIAVATSQSAQPQAALQPGPALAGPPPPVAAAVDPAMVAKPASEASVVNGSDANNGAPVPAINGDAKSNGKKRRAKNVTEGKPKKSKLKGPKNPDEEAVAPTDANANEGSPAVAGSGSD